jgi:acyl-CoA synthetase (AMP-forming)/AMP-acid ligase II
MAVPVDEAMVNVTNWLVDGHIAANRGDRAALRFGDRRYTYHDLAALANRAGHLLRRCGAAVEDRLLLALRESPAFFGLLLGAMKVGVAPVIVPIVTGRGAFASAVVQSEPRFAVVEPVWVDEVESARPGLEVIVAGESVGSRASLAIRLREMPSSLAVEKVSEATPALVVAGRDGLLIASHGQLRAALTGGQVPSDLAGLELLEHLRRLRLGEEIVIHR